MADNKYQKSDLDQTVNLLYGPPQNEVRAPKSVVVDPVQQGYERAHRQVRLDEFPMPDDGAQSNAVPVSEEGNLSKDRPSIEVVMAMTMRISAINECKKLLLAKARGVEETDEVPPRNRALCDMGTLLEPIVKDLMRADGWTIRELPSVEHRVGGVLLTGHPDGIASHPVITSGQSVVLEVKTTDSSRIRGAASAGGDIYLNPGWVQQAALYTHALYGQSRPVVVAAMGRDSAEYRAEVIRTHDVERAYRQAIARLESVVDMHRRQVDPGPDYSPGHANCQSCPIRSACGNHLKAEPEGPNILTVEEMIQQVRVWALANRGVRAVHGVSPSKAKEAAKEVIKGHFIASEETEVAMSVDGQAYSLKLSKTPFPKVDFEKLIQLLPPDVREEVVTYGTKSAMRITPIKPSSSKK